MVNLVFVVLATLLTLLALAFVLAPLVRRPATGAPADKRAALQRAHAEGVLSDAELHAKLAALDTTGSGTDDPDGARIPARPARRSAWLLAAAVPLATLGLYLHLGAPAALQPGATLPAPPGATDATAAALQGEGAPSLAQAAEGLAERMRQSPDDLGGWMLLGRAYKNLQRFADARDALANAYRLAPQDPDVMVEYAEALTLAADTRRIEGEAAALLDAALAMQPTHQRALWLKGIQAYQAGDFAGAAATWTHLRETLPPEAEIHASLQARIDDALAQAGGAAAANTLPPAPAAARESTARAKAEDSTNLGITVQVEIAPELRERVAPGDVLFVFARAPQGPRMPLAIQRLAASELPLTVRLDDSTSMMPQLRLSSLPEVVVGARISRSGNATPQPGDLEALSDPVSSSGSDPVRLRISRVVE